MNHIEDRCSCHLTGDDPNCVLHGEAIQFDGIPDLQEMFGMRAAPAMPVAAPVGRIIDGGTVLLKPYEPKAPPVPVCRCDLPTLYGHDTGCEQHPAPILADPLQMLVAAAQLISDQPTTEQWKTIKKAIRDLVPSP